MEYLSLNYNFDNKSHIQFPDIFIQKENRVIEVKSTWTYTSKLEQNIEKQKSAKEQGYNFEFWIFNRKGILNII